MTKKATINMENATIKIKSEGKKGLMVICTGKDSNGDKYSITRHLRYDSKQESYFGRGLNARMTDKFVDFGTPEDWAKKNEANLAVEKAA